LAATLPARSRFGRDFKMARRPAPRRTELDLNLKLPVRSRGPANSQPPPRGSPPSARSPS
jgi:hypothetical protein